MCVLSRLKVEELEAERQRLEEQNSTLEMRLDRQLLQVGVCVCVCWRCNSQASPALVFFYSCPEF